MQASAPRSAISLRPCPVRMSEWREFSKGADSCMLFPGWFARLWEDASSSVERRGLFPWLPTSDKKHTEMFMKWDPGEILIILNHIKMCGNSSLSKKLKTPNKQHHGPVGPSNSRSCCTWQCDFWWPRLRPFEFAFCLSLNYNYNYNYQKYNSVSCTHMYNGWQWCNIKLIQVQTLPRNP